MVKLLRVDERLLHGQVAVSWVTAAGATSILIANDAVMNDEMAKVALKLAKPASANLAIRSIAGAVDLLKDPRSKDIAIFVIVRTIEDALRLVEQTGDLIKHVNIGGIRKSEGGRMIADSLYISDTDYERVQKLEGMVDEVEFRMVASDPKRTLRDIVS